MATLLRVTSPALRHHDTSLSCANAPLRRPPDFDKDSLLNLIEWACGLNPTTASVLSAPMAPNGGNLEFTYTRSVAEVNAGAVFIVEWSDILPAPIWSTSGVTQQILSDNGTLQQVLGTLPVGSSGRRFVHLKVTGPP